MGALGYLAYARKLISKRHSEPIYVVLFLTQDCTANCLHCLRGNRKSPIAQGKKGENLKWEDLSFDEIEKISRSMGKILFLLLTGGEPFLRDDLADIAYTFYKNNSVKNLGIPTNGSLTERIVKITEEILRRCPKLDFALDISIDGIGKDHDEIRASPGLFNKAIETYRRLARLTLEYPNFNLNVALTVSHYNQDKLEEIYRYLTENLKVKTINHLLTRGNPRNTFAKEVNIDNYRHLNALLEKGMACGKLVGYHGYVFSDLVNAMRLLRQDIIADIASKKRRYLACYAAELGVVIDSNADVWPCELLAMRLGNLRESNYDFGQIWKTKVADEVRKYIRKNKCFCTYECFLTVNILFSAKVLPQLFQRWFRLKLQKLLL